MPCGMLEKLKKSEACGPSFAYLGSKCLCGIAARIPGQSTNLPGARLQQLVDDRAALSAGASYNSDGRHYVDSG